MRDGSIRRRVGSAAGWILVAALLAAVSLPADARAMCCLCRDCSGAAFCVDGLANSLACSSFCFTNGCPSTVFDSTDTCAGGCDGAPDAPTATASATATPTPTATASATLTGSATSTPPPTATSTSTATATETAAASATATLTPGTPAPLAGHIRYYVGDRPVPDVDVMQIGDTPGSVMTNAEGDYAFSSAGPGEVTIRPQKDGDFNVAITSLDAVTVLQAVAGEVTLSPDQELAADVTGNGTFSTLDAVRILQFQASIIDRLPAAELCESDWLFVPEPSPTPNQTLVEPVVAGGTCQRGAIALDPFTPPLAGRDFRAILLGDVTGNWTP
ncbi:hypothetical protein KF840_25035 [bacterium]|nr:hypothetical protein [bacterium]